MRYNGWRKRIPPSASGQIKRLAQTIIAGMGELHLEIIVDRLLREFKVEANVGKPQVAYRRPFARLLRWKESLSANPVDMGQYCHVWLELEPLEPGAGFQFEQDCGRCGPREYVPAKLRLASRKPCNRVYWLGFPVVDVKAALVDGSYHEVDSSEMAFKSCRFDGL